MKSELSRLYPYCLASRFAADACAATTVVAVGVAGLSASCWLRKVTEPWVNIHLLFCLLLSGWLISHAHMRVRQLRLVHPSDVDLMSRHISRLAYLVMYAVVGTKMCFGLVAAAGSGSFAPTDEPFFTHPVSGLFDPNDDYQMFLASGLIALVVVRAMVRRLRLRCLQGARIGPRI